MEAYRSNLGPKEAQCLVRAFSSATYTFHRRIEEDLDGRWTISSNGAFLNIIWGCGQIDPTILVLLTRFE
jgi:hypothetical protein